MGSAEKIAILSPLNFKTDTFVPNEVVTINHVTSRHLQSEIKKSSWIAIHGSQGTQLVALRCNTFDKCKLSNSYLMRNDNKLNVFNGKEMLMIPPPQKKTNNLSSTSADTFGAHFSNFVIRLPRIGTWLCRWCQPITNFLVMSTSTVSIDPCFFWPRSPLQLPTLFAQV